MDRCSLSVHHQYRNFFTHKAVLYVKKINEMRHANLNRFRINLLFTKYSIAALTPG